MQLGRNNSSSTCSMPAVLLVITSTDMKWYKYNISPSTPTTHTTFLIPYPFSFLKKNIYIYIFSCSLQKPISRIWLEHVYQDKKLINISLKNNNSLYWHRMWWWWWLQMILINQNQQMNPPSSSISTTIKNKNNNSNLIIKLKRL